MYTAATSSLVVVIVYVPVDGNTIEPVSRNEKLSLNWVPFVATACGGPLVVQLFDIVVVFGPSPVAKFDGGPLKLVFGQ